MRLLKLRQFVESDELELCGLVSVFIAHVFKVPKRQRGT